MVILIKKKCLFDCGVFQKKYIYIIKSVEIRVCIPHHSNVYFFLIIIDMCSISLTHHL